MLAESYITVLKIFAETTFYVGVSVICGGFVSGVVALGFVQIYWRERIQSRIMTEFFNYHPIEIEYALGMDASTLCRLYYRQISGQFLAAVTAEASGDPPSRKTPVLDLFVSGHAALPPEYGSDFGSNRRLEAAVRRIDVLQAQLGDGVARAVLSAIARVWSVVYTLFGVFAVWQLTSRAGSDAQGPAGTISYLMIALSAVTAVAVSTLLAILIAFSSAACGLVAFAALDRFVASR